MLDILILVRDVLLALLRGVEAGIDHAAKEARIQIHGALLRRRVNAYRTFAKKSVALADRLEIGPHGAAWMSAEEREAFQYFQPHFNRFFARDAQDTLLETEWREAVASNSQDAAFMSERAVQLGAMNHARAARRMRRGQG